MKVIFEGSDTGMKNAAAFVNQLWLADKFWQEIILHGNFDYSTIAPDEIVSRLRSSDASYTVKMWRPSLLKRAYYANTVAMTDTAVPFVLFYHTKFAGNSAADKAGTIAHEFVHNIDNNDGQSGTQMGHGDNDWRGKENSAPYWIGGRVAARYRQAHDDHLKSFDGDSDPYCGQIDGHASDGDVVEG